MHIGNFQLDKLLQNLQYTISSRKDFPSALEQEFELSLPMITRGPNDRSIKNWVNLPLGEYVIAFLITFADSEQGASARYEVVDLLRIPVEKIDLVI